jgi:hypothetical protein
MMAWTTKAGTALALGLPNIARVVAYRLALGTGLGKVRRLRAPVPQAPFFGRPADRLPQLSLSPVDTATLSLFGWCPIDLTGAAPDWMVHPLTRQRMPHPERNWWEIPDFDPAVGDIKPIWEMSRMDWVLVMALRARSALDSDGTTELDRLNQWLAHWNAQNPPYRGPNWKCGQEASIRVIHLAAAALVLQQVQAPTDGLRSLLGVHLARIAPTVSYAMAQDNNHGTSEAAALFIGGSWLAALGDPKGQAWMKVGRRLLENRVARLVDRDGTFSQYSLNYHRLMLDTLCIAEVWRRQLALPEFSARWRTRAAAAAHWLFRLVDADTGDGPNVGANDGAWILRFGVAGEDNYRDYRASVQRAMALFAGQRAYAGEGRWNQGLDLLGIELPPTPAPAPISHVADAGGFAVLRRGRSMAMLRYPRFRFRPAQADALHLDLWRDGINLLRDAGTYSYNTEPRWLDYFGGTASHNTIAFDERDQMPRLGRFLFGRWLRTSVLSPLAQDGQGVRFGAGYTDAWRARHVRQVRLEDTALVVEDTVDGFADKAVLRWRLAPGPWHRDGHRVMQGRQVLTVSANVPISRLDIVQGWESRCYLRKSSLPVLEIEIRQSGTLSSTYQWAT